MIYFRARFPVLPFTSIFLACTYLGLLSPLAEAYKCKPLGSPLEGLNEAAAVFIGKVTKVEEQKSVRITEFAVDQYWKGPGRRTITVRSGTHLYGYKFMRGQKYLVYASSGTEGLETSRCSRTRGIGSATLDLRELGKGKRPE